MQASKFYPNNGEGLVLTEPGDFSQSAFKVSCPANCAQKSDNKMSVMGPAAKTDSKSNRIYVLDSSICGSAIHAGVISDAEGGDILIHLCKGRDS
jgi:hypothetical protein